MTEVGAVYVPLKPVAKGFAADMQRQIGGQVGGLGTKSGDDYSKRFASSATGGIRGRASAMFSSLASAGKLAAIGAGYAAGKVLADSIGAASDLGETVSKVNQIFGGPQGKAIVVWAENAAKAMGQSQQQALDAAATFATFGKSAGLTGGDLTEFSTDLTGLATDLASFHNTTPQEAIEAIGAALRGESEPLRRYGVLLDDATLRQEALRLGLTKTTKDALTPQQKVLAAQSQIFKQTSDAQGDFERTSGGLANQTRILSAQWADAKAELGQGLLPVMLRLADAGNDAFAWVEDHKGDIKAFVSDLGDAVEPAVSEVREALGHLVGEGDGLGHLLTDDLIPAVRTTSELIGKLVNWVDELPGPVKDTAVQVGIAAFAFGKMSGAIKTLGLTSLITNLKSAETRTAALQGAARNAAGIGGLLALAHGAKESDRTLGVLESTAGGAALGFSVGGPWGAAVGTVAGLATGLATAGDESSDAAAAFKTSVPDVESLRDAFDQLTGAVDESGRALVLSRLREQLQGLVDLDVGESNFGELTKQYGSFATMIEDLPDGTSVESLARTFGLSARDIVDATTGMPKAVGKVREALGSADRSVYETRVAYQALKNILGPVTGEFRKNRDEVRRDAAATASYRDLLGDLRNKVRRPIIAQFKDNAPDRAKEVARLATRYDLTPKEIKTVIHATGVDISMADVKSLIKQLDDTDKQRTEPQIHANAGPARDEMSSFIRDFHALDNDHVDTWIYTHHQTVNEPPRGPVGDPTNDDRVIIPRVIPTAGPASRVSPTVETAPAHGRGLRAGDRLVLVLEDGSELGAFVDERVSAADGMRAETARAAGRGF